MRNILLFIIGGIFSIYDSSGQTASYSVIPSPQLVKTTGQDSFHLKKNTTITYPKGNELLKRNAEFLSEYIGQATGNALRWAAVCPSARRRILSARTFYPRLHLPQ